jgi:hypothetical protein
MGKTGRVKKRAVNHRPELEQLRAENQRLKKVYELFNAENESLKKQLAMAQDAADKGEKGRALGTTVEGLKEALLEYGQHEIRCAAAQFQRGEPTKGEDTKNGRYRSMYDGKWYYDDDMPPCTCGFSQALNQIEE